MFQVLADHPDVQKQLRAEVVAVHAQGDLSYAELMALPLLDAVCRETLRMYVVISSELCDCFAYHSTARYPPVAFTLRTCAAILCIRRPDFLTRGCNMIGP